MDLSSISPSAVVGSQMAAASGTASILVMRRVLDMAAAQGAMLAQMIDQGAGLGRNLDITA
jgi:hypothetical protein